LKRISFIICPLFFAACSLIDDNLSLCSEKLILDYELQLHTELSMQLQTELVTDVEMPVRNALTGWLAPIFTDKAKDVDLRFFSTDTDELRRLIQEEINDSRTSYTFQLPKENYMHLGVANIHDNHQVVLSEAAHAATMELVATETDELPSFSMGVFTARKHMEIGDTSQQFDVHLYMATCAVAVVIDTTTCDSLVSLRGMMSGTASSFSVRDSVYHYNGRHHLVFDEVLISEPVAAQRHRAPRADTARLFSCMATSGFPTEEGKSWSVVITATLTDNRHTRTTLKIDEPVRAGTLRILRAHMDATGGIQPDKKDGEDGQHVGATVELDWKEGDNHDVEI